MKLSVISVEKELDGKFGFRAIFSLYNSRFNFRKEIKFTFKAVGLFFHGN